MAPKVVILSAFASPLRSGAEACAEEVAARLQGSYDITIVTARMRSNLPTQDRFGDVNVVRVGVGRPIDKWLFPFLGALAAKRLQPTLIHAVLESYAGLALLLCRSLVPGAKRLLTCQSTNTSFLLRPIHRAAHAVTVISSVLRDRAVRLGVSKPTLIPNGIDLSGIATAKTGSPRMPGRILFVGRLEPMKGVDTLLQALALLRADERWTLHIVGEGSMLKEWKKLAKQLDIADRARFLGRLTGPLLWNEYAEARIFCGLSRSEALGNVFLEAQASGCAVVASNVGGIPDIVQDGVTGLLVPPEDPDAAAAAITRLLDDADLRIALSQAAIAHAAQYGWDAIARRYAEVYASLVTPSRRRRPR